MGLDSSRGSYVPVPTAAAAPPAPVVSTSSSNMATTGSRDDAPASSSSSYHSAAPSHQLHHHQQSHNHVRVRSASPAPSHHLTAAAAAAAQPQQQPPLPPQQAAPAIGVASVSSSLIAPHMPPETSSHQRFGSSTAPLTAHHLHPAQPKFNNILYNNPDDFVPAAVHSSRRHHSSSSSSSAAANIGNPNAASNGSNVPFDTSSAQRVIASVALRIPWQPILQRVPGVALVIVMLLGLFGAAYLPYITSAYFILLHVLVIASSLRLAYGMFCVRIAARQASTTDWVEKYCQATGTVDGFDLSHDVPFENVTHTIIIPNYKEDLDTLCETLDILGSHPRASTNYKICLAMEAAEAGSEEKAMTLVRLYAEHFLDIVFTIHPSGREGEVPGKGSNVCWAAKQMYRMSKDHKCNVFTIMDADTSFAADYFCAVAYHFSVATPDERRMLMFAPCTVFDRNSKDVPGIVRQVDVMWSIGVMSNMYPSADVVFPCSAYSISVELAATVGFWDTGADALGEDMHMYLKCFYATEGNVIVKKIYSPASCCNIEGEGVIGNVFARYTQAKRHLWGCLDTGYALRNTVLGILAPGWNGPIIRRSQSDAKVKGSQQVAEGNFSIRKLFVLFSRLFEAHIFGAHTYLLTFMWAALIPTGPTPSAFAVFFWESITTEGVHPFVLWTADLCGWLRFLGILPIVCTIYNYENYHEWVGIQRWRLSDMGTSNQPANKARVQPLGRRAQLITQRTYWNLLDWAWIPLCGLLFMTVPQLHAQFTQMWTDRLTYVVAMKPQLAPRARPLLASAIQNEMVELVQHHDDHSSGDLYMSLLSHRADVDSVSPGEGSSGSAGGGNGGGSGAHEIESRSSQQQLQHAFFSNGMQSSSSHPHLPSSRAAAGLGGGASSHGAFVHHAHSHSFSHFGQHHQPHPIPQNLVINHSVQQHHPSSVVSDSHHHNHNQHHEISVTPTITSSLISPAASTISSSPAVGGYERGGLEAGGPDHISQHRAGHESHHLHHHGHSLSVDGAANGLQVWHQRTGGGVDRFSNPPNVTSGLTSSSSSSSQASSTVSPSPRSSIGTGEGVAAVVPAATLDVSSQAADDGPDAAQVRGDSGFFELDEAAVLNLGSTIPSSAAAASATTTKKRGVGVERTSTTKIRGGETRVLPVVVNGEIRGSAGGFGATR